MNNILSEKEYQRYIIERLVGENGYIERKAACFDRAFAMDREMLFKFLFDTQLVIEVVITSLRAVNTDNFGQRYDDIETVLYEIEEVHYKRRITVSNQKMIDECDALICYVDEGAYQSGAKTALRYAQRKGLQIFNLWTDSAKN